MTDWKRTLLGGSEIGIKISIKTMKQLFHPCTTEYILNTCHGRCCHSSAGKTPSMIIIHPAENEYIESKGGIISDQILELKDGICPFKGKEGKLCTLHPSKPLACSYHPFKLNKNNTLIVMRKYNAMICYACKEEKIPVYEAHKWCLIQMFGTKEAERIIEEIKKGKNKDFFGFMNFERYKKIRYIENKLSVSYKKNV